MESRFSEETINIAKQIGEFYLEKNKGDYEKTREEIERLRIVDIVQLADTVEIKAVRVGLLIGPGGKNINQLEQYLGQKIYIKEEKESLLDYIIPVPEMEYDDYEEEYTYFPLQEEYEDYSYDPFYPEEH